MNWPEFFISLENFLPVKVPMRPALNHALIGFFSVLVFSFLVYSTSFTREDKEKMRKNMRLGQFLYTIFVISAAWFVGKTAYNSKFYYDNLKFNSKWLNYRSWFGKDLPIF